MQRKIFRDEEKELTEKEHRRLPAAVRERKSERLLPVMESGETRRGQREKGHCKSGKKDYRFAISTPVRMLSVPGR
ncbi:MAG: hypothetical protein HDT14_10400 [Oscillibacter sp.]|nr:hypothetical protein [Oscillibacter sp.]